MEVNMAEKENKKEDVIPKKVAAAEEINILTKSKSTLIINIGIFVITAILAQYTAIAAQILAATGIIYDVLEMQKIKKYLDYLKKKYDL